MLNKIIIFGFPHCGTTILRCILGHIDDVYCEINEMDQIHNNLDNKKYYLCKFPYLIDINDNKYHDYIKIFIIRNPLFVFSSLNKRFDNNLGKNHSLDKYLETISKFIYFKNNPQKNLYTIRYEDMFENNYINLKNIFDSIGFKYNDKIFNNLEFENISHTNVKKVNYKPTDKEHEIYRNWQINQPFIYSDNKDKLFLLEEQKNTIINNPEILTVYPDITDLFAYEK